MISRYVMCDASSLCYDIFRYVMIFLGYDHEHSLWIIPILRLSTYGCPIAARDGHDFPRLIDKRIPGVAAVIDDVVEGFENSVRQPVLPHELPDIFLAVEFRRARRKLQERDVVWNLEGLGAMPPGLIEEENSVSARSDFGCDLIEVKLHSFGVAGRQHEGGASSAFGADRTEQVGRLGPLIMGSTGA